MPHDPHIRSLARVVRGVGAPPDDLLEASDLRGIRVYRRLMRDRLVSSVEATLPRTVLLLGRDRLGAWVEDFLAERAPRSPYFRDAGGEIMRWGLLHHAQSSGLPAFFADAAQLELAFFEVSTCARDAARPQTPLALHLPVQFTSASALLRLKHAVHHEWRDEAPRPGRVDLLVYRDANTKRAHRLELTEPAARIILRLRAGATLQVGITAGLADASVEVDDEVLGEVSRLLADLAERRVILGAVGAE